MYAAQALGLVGEEAGKHKGVLDAILTALFSKFDWELQTNAAYALGQMPESASTHQGVINGLFSRTQ